MTDTIPARAPLTPAEKTIVTDLATKIAETESQFCCGGTIELSAERKLSLLYKVGEEKHIRTGSLDLPQIRETDIDQLLDACSPSSHGRGKETVYDESYRLARELEQGNFALTADILAESGILASISTLTTPIHPIGGDVPHAYPPRNMAGNLVAHLYKLNAYGVGGFFRFHRDTPKSDRHVGTLVVALPIPFEGGALRVCHEGKEILFDWGKDTFPSPDEAGSLPWAFLFSDVEHEVLPVTSGTRITLAYDIFTSSLEAPLSELSMMDATSLPLYSDLKLALKNPEFLPHGGKLGVALSHCYPVNPAGEPASFTSRLKGRDAGLVLVFHALELDPILRAVYEPDGTRGELEKRPQDYEGIPDDGFGPLIPAQPTSYDPGEPQILLTTTSFSFTLMDDVEWEEGQAELIREHVGACVEPDVIWVCKPSKNLFTPSGHYVAYGNQAVVNSVYVAAALVLHVPAFGQGIRDSS